MLGIHDQLMGPTLWGWEQRGSNATSFYNYVFFFFFCFSLRTSLCCKISPLYPSINIALLPQCVLETSNQPEPLWLKIIQVFFFTVNLFVEKEKKCLLPLLFTIFVPSLVAFQIAAITEPWFLPIISFIHPIPFWG